MQIPLELLTQDFLKDQNNIFFEETTSPIFYASLARIFAISPQS